jgi:hypothetical protein
LSSILSTCPNHLILCDLINLTISSLYNNVFSSALCLILHTLFSITGPYILRIIFSHLFLTNNTFSLRDVAFLLMRSHVS